MRGRPRHLWTTEVEQQMNVADLTCGKMEREAQDHTQWKKLTGGHYKSDNSISPVSKEPSKSAHKLGTIKSRNCPWQMSSISWSHSSCCHIPWPEMTMFLASTADLIKQQHRHQLLKQTWMTSGEWPAACQSWSGVGTEMQTKLVVIAAHHRIYYINMPWMTTITSCWTTTYYDKIMTELLHNVIYQRVISCNTVMQMNVPKTTLFFFSTNTNTVRLNEKKHPHEHQNKIKKHGQQHLQLTFHCCKATSQHLYLHHCVLSSFLHIIGY